MALLLSSSFFTNSSNLFLSSSFSLFTSLSFVSRFRLFLFLFYCFLIVVAFCFVLFVFDPASWSSPSPLLASLYPTGSLRPGTPTGHQPFDYPRRGGACYNGCKRSKTLSGGWGGSTQKLEKLKASAFNAKLAS